MATFTLFRPRIDFIPLGPGTQPPSPRAVPLPVAVIPQPRPVPLPPTRILTVTPPAGGATAPEVPRSLSVEAPPVESKPVGMKLTTCSTCGGHMETPATSATPPLAALRIETGLGPEGGATPPAAVTEGAAAPGKPKPGGAAGTVALVAVGVLVVAGVWWLLGRRGGAA